MNDGKVVYRQQIAHCGKPRCRKCREGIGHGPYWYAYRTENGVTKRTYIGKHLPPEALALVETMQEQENGIPLTTLTLTSTGLNHASVRLFTLGQLRLERRRGQQWLPILDVAWQEQSVRTLLGYLVSSPARSVRRRHAIAALWPDLDIETAGEKLNQCVDSLSLLLEPARSARGRAQHPTFPLLRSEGESLILAEQARVWVDADAFEYLAARTQTGDLDERRGLLEEAARLYFGDFLPEERHLRVVISRRRALQSRWIALLLDLAELRLAGRAIPAAIDTLNLLLTNDPLNEAAVQLLILALARSQRRGEALRAYQRLAELLQREYDSVPSERTRALYDAVLRGDDAILRDDDANSDMTGETPDESATDEQPRPNRSHVSSMPVTALSANGGEGLQIGRTHQSPLVGRERELEALRGLLSQGEHYAEVYAGGQHGAVGIPLDTQRVSQCVVLMGDAGIGKTRLAEEVSREAQRRGWTVLWSRIYAQERGIPYRLWIEVLRKALDQGVWQEEEISGQPSLYQPLVALLPELESTPPQGVTSAGSSAPLALSGLLLEQEQSRLWDAVYQLLATASETTPLAIVLDDVQWADGASCQLLAHLARRVHTHPILLIATCRENELAEGDSPLRQLIAEMLREHSVMTLDIAPLTSEQIGALVSHNPNLPETMLRHIQDRAAGNPFFAEELARTTPPTLPRTIAAALDHRLSRLSDLCRLLLGNAAILGGSFEFPVISAMGMERSGSGEPVDEDTLLDVLDEALQAGVLTEEGTGAHISYHFWHPLLASHLYDGISLTRRTRLHRRAADALREMHAGRQEEVAATITHHLLQGRAEPALIASYAEMAGDRAYLLSVYSEAERYYRQAVEAMEAAHKGNGRTVQDGDWQGEAPHFISLLERLAECVMILGNFEEGRGLYERILTLRHRYPATDARYEAQVRSLLWGEIERTWRYTGNQARVKECSERSEQVLREADVQGGPAWAKLRYQQSSHSWQEGRYEEASRAAQEALILFEQKQNVVSPPQSASRLTRIQRILAGDPVELGRTYTLLGNIAMGAGKHGEALSYLKRALAIYEQYDQKRGIAHVSCNLGYLHLKKAEYELALSFLHRSLDLAGRLGDAPLSSVVFSNLGELAALSGDFAEAEQWYKKALTLTEGFKDREYMSRWNACLASVLQAQDRLDEAATCAVRALYIGRAMRNSPCIGLALLALANLRIAQAQRCSGKQAKARTRLLAHAQKNIQRALALAGLEAETRTRSLLALAETYLLLSRAGKAQTLLHQVVEEARRYELVSVEQEARKLLAK